MTFRSKSAGLCIRAQRGNRTATTSSASGTKEALQLRKGAEHPSWGGGWAAEEFRTGSWDGLEFQACRQCTTVGMSVEPHREVHRRVAQQRERMPKGKKEA